MKKKNNRYIPSVSAPVITGLGADKFDIELDVFINHGVTPEDLRFLARVLGEEIILENSHINYEITDGMAFALGYTIAKQIYRYNESISCDNFVERFANALVKTVHLAKSADGKQSRASVSLVKLFSSAARFRRSKNINNNRFSSFIEIVEELPTPRKGKKVRIQNSRGRPRGAGSYKESDRQLLLKFRMDHDRLPKYAAEYEALAETARGKDSTDTYDRSSTIIRLRRAATALRRE